MFVYHCALLAESLCGCIPKCASVYVFEGLMDIYVRLDTGPRLLFIPAQCLAVARMPAYVRLGRKCLRWHLSRQTRLNPSMAQAPAASVSCLRQRPACLSTGPVPVKVRVSP